jgi:hypothetical protein
MAKQAAEATLPRSWGRTLASAAKHLGNLVSILVACDCKQPEKRCH